MESCSSSSDRCVRLVEPSKTGFQHITLLEGLLRAVSSASERNGQKCEFWGSESTVALLRASVVDGVDFKVIPVVCPTKRRFVAETFWEVVNVVRAAFKTRRSDICLVTCLLPTSLLVLETINWILPRPIRVVIHGEVEGLVDDSLAQGVGSFGFWIRKWTGIRGRRTKLGLVVLEDFVAEFLAKVVPGITSREEIGVIHHPIVPLTTVGPKHGRTSVCVIGLETGMKNYAVLDDLVERYPDIDLLQIGGGKVLNLRTGEATEIDDFHTEIGRCHVALFPYERGYAVSMSASLFDAIATSVPIIAFDRPYFARLSQKYDFIEVVAGSEQLRDEFEGLVEDITSRECNWEEIRVEYGLSTIQGQVNSLFNL